MRYRGNEQVLLRIVGTCHEAPLQAGQCKPGSCQCLHMLGLPNLVKCAFFDVIWMFRPLLLTGRTRRCLNLGSYNYLGFAAADEYCTPRVIKTMGELGWGTCSSRAEAGKADHDVLHVLGHD
jgi:hypothetical protein